MKIAVGEPLDPAKRPRPEGVHYQLEDGGHVVYAFFEDPEEREVNAYRHGKIELAVYIEQPAIFLLMQAGMLPWCDMPYSWHLVPDAHKPAFRVDEQDKLGLVGSSGSELLTIILADSRNTVVRAIRAVTMPQHVSATIRAEMARQAATPWDARAYDFALAKITSGLETSAMLERAKARGVAGK